MKICKSCKQNKSYSEFGRSKWSDGYRAVCNLCRNTVEAPKYYQSHKEDIQRYKQENRQKILDYSKEYYSSNASYFANYRTKHADKYRNWRQTHREYICAYRKHRRDTDPQFKITCSLRSRTSTLLRRAKTKKTSSTLKLLGCSLAELKQHLEKQFQKGMSWENYGQWHLDHIRPCVSFDFARAGQQEACFHYSNLQPLWAKDNFIKGCSWRQDDKAQ